MLKFQTNTLPAETFFRVGVIGYVEEKFHFGLAKRLIAEAISKANKHQMSNCKKIKPLLLVLNDRNQGISTLVFKHAASNNLTLAKIRPKLKTGDECLDTSYDIFAGKAEGEEQVTFLANIDILVCIGAANHKTKMAQELGIATYQYILPATG